MDLHINMIFVYNHVRFDEVVFPFVTKSVLQVSPIFPLVPWVVSSLRDPLVMTTIEVPATPAVVVRLCLSRGQPTAFRLVTRTHAMVTRSILRAGGTAQTGPAEPTCYTHAVRYPEWLNLVLSFKIRLGR